MITIKIETLQRKLKKPIKRNIKVLGLDVASKTGFAKIYVDQKNISIEYGSIDVKTTDIYEKMNRYIEEFLRLIDNSFLTIIEDCFVGINPKGSLQLAKLEGVAYTICRTVLPDKQPRFIQPLAARKLIGVPGKGKKYDVAIWLKKNLNLSITDEDAADAIVLAICGILAE